MKYAISNRIFINYKHLSIITLIFLGTSTEVYAVDWTLIKKTKDYALLVDMDSYNEAESLPFITAKTVFNSPQLYKFNGKNLYATEVHSTNQFNCKSDTYKELETYYYKNKLLASLKGARTFKPLEKASDNAAIAGLTCQVHKMVGGM